MPGMSPAEYIITVMSQVRIPSACGFYMQHFLIFATYLLNYWVFYPSSAKHFFQTSRKLKRIFCAQPTFFQVKLIRIFFFS